ncbi:MAG: preprotein translocase subunit YajC [Clostridiales bacterium]|nr:preprotein translocase subunit YajC [Clostridiales bacterium]
MLQNFLSLLNQGLGLEIGPDTAAQIAGSASGAGDAAAAGTEAAANAANTAANAAAAGDMSGSILMFVVWGVVIVGMYFLLMRPQRKREKQMKEMQAAIKAGDEVITAGGFFGRVADVGEDCFIVEFGTNRGIRIPVQKSDVLGIRSPKTTPAPALKTE